MHQKIEILVIEDNSAEADMIKRMLSASQKIEFSVHHVEYLADGLNLLKDRDFDAILCDLGLPDSQGLETALALRKQSSQKPIIVLTVLDDEDAALQSLQMDIQDYLIKGEITSGLLIRSIRYAIQRKSDSEALRESEQRFAAFMRHMPSAAWIKDLDGRYLYANPLTERLFSSSLPELLGKTDDGIVPPEYARRFIENDRRVLASGEELKTTETLRLSDQIEHHFMVTKFVVPGPDGRPAYIAGVALDITESRRQEAEIQRLASFPRLDPSPILELDADGNMTYCNPAAEEILKRMGPGNSSNPFIPPELPSLLQDLKGRSVPCLLREVEINGAFFDENICFVPQYDAVRIYTLDITGRKKAEQEREYCLLERESVLESINEGVMISDLRGNILTMNREALTMLEYESIEQISRPLSEYRDSFELFDLDGRAVPFQEWPMSRALRGERFADLEVQARRKDTGKSWIVSYNGTPVRDMSGDAILAVVTFRDITERKQTEQAIRAQAALLDLAHDAIIVRGEEDRVTFWSQGAQETYGWTRQEAMGQVTHELLKTRFPKPVAELNAELVEKGRWDGELTHTRKDGREITVASRWAVQRDWSERQAGVLEINSDITDRKGAEEEINRLNTNLAARVSELEESNQEIEGFNRMVSHDLRQPLHAIGTSCQAINMLCGDKLDEECKSYVTVAYDKVRQMNDLIEALLKFSSSAHIDLQRETFNLSELADGVVAGVKMTAPERRVTFKIADTLMVNGDPKLLRSVLENLIGNAWKYTGGREEAIIELGAVEIGGKQAYFIRDNGSGFHISDADKLFKPFKRLSGAEEFNGFGIGLATVDRIIRRHGGRIWAEGEPGKGATFYFTLSSDAIST